MRKTLAILIGLVLAAPVATAAPAKKKAAAQDSACVACHAKTSPGIVAQHKDSAHFKSGEVDCATCHGSDPFMALMDGRTILDLAEGLQLRRVRIMGAERIELSGFTETMRERLTAYGLFHEIISWKLRMFVPTDAAGPVVLERVLGRYPVQRIGEREAA